jgi:hypothetical protein
MFNPFWSGNPAAIGQQTAVSQTIQARGMGQRTATRKRRKSAKRTRAAAAPRKRASKKRAGRARLVKGSAAAKAFMAKIRRKRRK